MSNSLDTSFTKLSEIMEARYDRIETKLGNIAVQYETANAAVTDLKLDIAKAANPLLDHRLTQQEKKAETIEARLNALEQRIYIWLGGLTVIGVLFQIFGEKILGID